MTIITIPNVPGPSTCSARLIVGVDTHKDFHVAAAIDDRGGLLDIQQFSATAAGYRRLREWAEQLAVLGGVVYGIEGTSSYGAGLAAALRRSGCTLYEVGRPNRRDRRLRGKTDAYDAENAAGAVLAGTASGLAKTADGQIEMIRIIKSAKRGAVKAVPRP